ncbi:MAG: FAD-binding oxidoreductase [Deltaproteobacteria bacterium]|nr:FAD-binding oxidoreductase [Deltaproteobacteria bacterium]
MTSAARLAPFSDLLPVDAILTSESTRAFSCGGLTPQYVLFPDTVDLLRSCMRAATQAGMSVMVVGTGAGLGLGNAPRQYDVAISTRRLNRIVAHEAADMTVTVQAGATLDEVNAALAHAGQHLPLDPPRPELTTIGGLIASDASGPLRLSHGKVRDRLIGITVVLADGTLVKGGGRVVKNVAGYDLMKLFTGSFGTLGAIVEATLTIRPCPERDTLLVIPAADTAGALTLALKILAAPVMPSYIEAFNASASAEVGADHRARLMIGCGGHADEVSTQHARCAAHAGEQPLQVHEGVERARWYAALRDWPSSGLTADLENALGAKLSLLPSQLATILPRIEQEAVHRNTRCAILARVGSGIAYVRLIGADAAHVMPVAAWLRTTARQAGGWTAFDRVPAPLRAQLDTWGEAPAVSLMRGIKQTLDPQNRLSPGRFVGGI